MFKIKYELGELGSVLVCGNQDVAEFIATRPFSPAAHVGRASPTMSSPYPNDTSPMRSKVDQSIVADALSPAAGGIAALPGGPLVPSLGP